MRDEQICPGYSGFAHNINERTSLAAISFGACFLQHGPMSLPYRCQGIMDSSVFVLLIKELCANH